VHFIDLRFTFLTLYRLKDKFTFEKLSYPWPYKYYSFED